MELRKLTKGDYDILKAMENVVDGVARMYGKHTEVVLHTLDENSPSILKIANGHVTGREAGAPITNLALLKLKEGHDVSDSYMTKTSTGKTLRSITTIVRNPKGKAIGLFCINSDMDVPMQSFLQHMFPLDHGMSEGSPETFAKNIDETIESTIATVKSEVLDDSSIAPSKRNREVVTRLYELGIFKYKDSKPLTAEILEISRDTVYLYLRELDAK
ncbi:PAS domain-containing protein [Vibrio sp. D404a]|uniref:helix-turn-helix transcriptional regulator n=1 Tax=unclassified Vibrio TaxID=2614977 RepID=UPI0025534D50|nr:MULTISPECIES: PAS domain-containing protein [unclassified Vibrio]MDK9739331.1 PAS domain-containing protein [Vibrio sp. D404a]MDK9797634.1 PAS domain-containing protein [Vibrio sp. D449a]